MDNPVDNSSDDDAISPLDTRHIRIIGMVVLAAMLVVIFAAMAGVIATVRP